jgi:hypothetical protein
MLCENAVQRWRDFVASRGRIRYTESVCGTSHVLDAKLPEDALRSAHCGHDVAAVDERYCEPIAAMQDFDLEFPDPVEYAYYAIYNLFLKYGCHEDIDDWLIVNQSLSSETDESKWRSLLQEALTRAM